MCCSPRRTTNSTLTPPGNCTASYPGGSRRSPASARSSTNATACGLPVLTRVATSSRSPTVTRVSPLDLRCAHVDGDRVGVEGERLDARAGRDRQRVAGVDVGVRDEEVPEHADAVAAHLAQRAVGVAVVHEPGRLAACRHRGRVVGRVGAHDPDDAVATDPGAAVAEAGHLLGGQLVLAVGVGHQHEVVLGAVALDEGVLGHQYEQLAVGRPSRSTRRAAATVSSGRSSRWASTARRGTRVGSHVSGPRARERMNDFEQWWKTSSMSTTSASSGRCPRTTISSKNGASETRRARPLIRSVSPRPGMRNTSPTWGFWQHVAVAVDAAVAGPLGDRDRASRR